jgi:hypothetical protein
MNSASVMGCAINGKLSSSKTTFNFSPIYQARLVQIIPILKLIFNQVSTWQLDFILEMFNQDWNQIFSPSRPNLLRFLNSKPS